MSTGTCRSCGANILWVETKAGKLMPIDQEPVLNGNLDVKDGVAIYVKAEPSVARFVSHFASCPNRDQHRRK